MSPWRWTPIFDFSLFLCGAIVLLSPLASSLRADSSSAISAGPVSADEAAILWKDGQADFNRGLDEDAIPKLERFVARYPGYPQYFDARHLLGRAYLRIRRATQAKVELKAFIQAQSRSTAALHARAELAQADLMLEEYHEALLTAEELLKITAAPNLLELRMEALALRAQAQIGLNQDARALSSIESARHDLPKTTSLALKGEIFRVSLELKLRHCRTFPSAGKLTEAQVRDQLQRRGTCLYSALLDFKQLLDAGHASSSEEGESLIFDAYTSYWKSCKNPPAPPALRPKDRDAQQLKTYFRELGAVLEEDCRQKIRQGLELLNGWNATATGSASDAIRGSMAGLEKLK